MDRQDSQARTPLPPPLLCAEARMERLNRIFLHISVASLVLTFLAFLSTILAPVLFFTALCVLFVAILVMVLFTLGLILFIPDNPVVFLWGVLGDFIASGDSAMYITAFCFNSTTWLSALGAITALLSIGLTAAGHRPGKIPKIVLLSLAILIFGFIFAFQTVTGGLQWQN